MNTPRYTKVHYAIAVIGVLILVGIGITIIRKNNTPPVETQSGTNHDEAGNKRRIPVSANIEIYDGQKLIKRYTVDEIKTASRELPQDQAVSPDQRMILVKTLLEELDIEKAEGFRFTGFTGETADLPWDEVMSAKEDVVLISTHAPAWKLVRQQEGNMIPRGDPSSIVMRAVKSITVAKDPRKMGPVGATGMPPCEHTKIYLSLADALKEKDKVCFLNLSGKNLTEVPTQLTQFPNLKILYLGHNKFTSVSEILGELKGLDTLNLNGNDLTTLPAEIGKLENLRILKLGRNKLETLPKSIGNLKKLEKLELDNNHLTSLPKEIGGLSSLTELEVAHNKLETLPREVGKLKNVSEIDIEDNPLSLEDIQFLKLTFPNADIEE